MSETKCPFAQDVQKFAGSALQHVAALVTDLHDLSEACRYYTEGVVADPCPHEPTQSSFLDEPDDASGRVEGDEKAPRVVKKPKPEHILRAQIGKPGRVPDAEDARAVIAGRDKVGISVYYDDFDRYCATNGLYMLNRVGKRYLAYCAGYSKIRDRMGTHIVSHSYEEAHY